jgi:malonyl-CoA O-methyltransferase
MHWLGRKKKPEVLTPLEGYNRWAASYQSESNPIKDLSDKLVEKLLPDLHGKSVLDYGCGTGRFCALAEKQHATRVVGVDLSPAMIERAQAQTKRTEFICADIRQANLEKTSFDVVINALVMGHVEDLNECLGRLLEVLKPGGVIVMTDFHPYLTLMESKRTFLDVASGRHFEVRHYLHLFEEYFRILYRNEFSIEALEEPRYNQTPVIFAMKAVKNLR